MKRIIALLLLLTLTNTAYSAEEDIYKGFAKFQTGRIENIFLNEVLTNISENRYFVELLPQTNEMLKSRNGDTPQSLIPLLQIYAKKDLSLIEDTVVCVIVGAFDQNDKVGKNNVDAFKKTFEKLSEYFGPNKESETIQNAKVELCAGKKDDEIEKAKTTLPDYQESIKAVIGLLKAEYISSQASWINPNTEEERKIYQKYKFALNAYYLADLYSRYEQAKKVDRSTANISLYEETHYLISAFENMGKEDEDNFGKARKISLFIAQLLDVYNAQQSDENVANTEKIISSFVQNETDSYNIKRNSPGLISRTCTKFSCKPAWGIGSYFGVVVGDNHKNSSNQKSAFYGPVGLEVKVANFNGGSKLFLGYAPLDFGPLIANELSDKQYTATLTDVRRDSVYLAYTYKHQPWAILFSRNEDTYKKARYMLTFGFDLPLYYF